MALAKPSRCSGVRRHGSVQDLLRLRLFRCSSVLGPHCAQILPRARATRRKLGLVRRKAMHRASAFSRLVAAIGRDVGGAGLVHVAACVHELRGLRRAGVMRRTGRGRRCRHLSRRWKHDQQRSNCADRLDVHETSTCDVNAPCIIPPPRDPRCEFGVTAEKAGQRGRLTDGISFSICSRSGFHRCFRAKGEPCARVFCDGLQKGRARGVCES